MEADLARSGEPPLAELLESDLQLDRRQWEQRPVPACVEKEREELFLEVDSMVGL